MGKMVTDMRLGQGDELQFEIYRSNRHLVCLV